MIAFIFIKVERGKAVDVLEAVRKIEGVVEAYAITGEFDIIAKTEVPDVAALGETITKKIHRVKGVSATITSIVVA